MTDETPQAAPNATAPQPPRMQILAQYVRDLSSQDRKSDV